MVEISQVEQVRSVSLLPGMPLPFRIPPRPKHLQNVDYLKKFDFTTVWYDVFRDRSRKKVVLSGPPLRNLKQAFMKRNASFFVGYKSRLTRIVKMDRCMELWLKTEHAKDQSVRFAGKGFRFDIDPSPNRCDWFRNRKVIVTISKDNKLEWISDWVDFNVRWHGADAVLFYDNASTSYSPETLLQTISNVAGISVAVVVCWPFCRGPGGPIWDSNYSQHGQLQNARWRFLADASGVLNSDIDEWVLTQPGTSVFALCEAAGGYLSFIGRWCHVRRDSNVPKSKMIRHRHHRWFDPTQATCYPKWAAIPQHIPDKAQWGVHGISKMSNEPRPSLLLRHFHRISTSWKYRRTRLLPEDDLEHCVEDSKLCEAFDLLGHK